MQIKATVYISLAKHLWEPGIQLLKLEKKYIIYKTVNLVYSWENQLDFTSWLIIIS